MINTYRKISEEILHSLMMENIDELEVDNKLNKRQAIINKLEGRELERFLLSYKDEDVYKIDIEIKARLEEKIIEVKKEIREYKTKKAVNTAYVNMNKNNFNIFSKKV